MTNLRWVVSAVTEYREFLLHEASTVNTELFDMENFRFSADDPWL